MKSSNKSGVVHVLSVLAVGALAVGLVFISQNMSSFSGDIRSEAAEAPQTITYTLKNNTDIANEDGASFSQPTSSTSDSWVGTGSDTAKSYLGLRFSGPKIPKGSVIQTAQLQFVQPKAAWISISFAVSAETTTNPETYSSEKKPSARILTANSIPYADNVKWESSQTYKYDVTKVIQELAATNDREAINLVLKGGATRFGRKSFSGSPASGKSPTLVITYVGAGSTATAQPTVRPSASASATPVATRSPLATSTARPTATDTPTTSGTGGNSHAMGVWIPTSRDTCTKEIHDSYHVVVEGKKYPTWHPPVHPATGCTFGHEHGRDPSGSDLLATIRSHYGTTGSGLPFGLANEKLDEWNISKGINNGMRHEDHVGHKIEWENNVELTRNKCANTPASPGCFEKVNIGVQCDFLMKVHQGTHSKDAFTNNMHELEYFVSCTDGTKISATKMVLFGKPGEFVANGKETIHKVGTATPANSTAGSGVRFIPTIEGIREHILVPNGSWSQFSNGLYEDWISANYIRTPEGRELAYFDPHFAVFSPSRYFDPSKPDNVGRSIDVCYMTESLGLERARGGECETLTNYGKNMTPVPYDDPRSPFNGVKREFYFNQSALSNSGGATIWYTDPFGGNAKTTPFTGSIKQYLAPINNNRGFALESNAIGAGRYYGGNGVHAPN